MDTNATKTSNTGGDDRVTVVCPNLSCRRMVSVPGSSRGQSVRCAYCNKMFRVPQKPQERKAALGGRRPS